MKRNLFSIMLGGVLVLTAPALTSCDDILGLSDNPVESSALAEAIKDGAEVTIDMSMTGNVEGENFSLDAQVTYEKKNGQYVFKTATADAGPDVEVDVDEETLELLAQHFRLKYEKSSNQIKFIGKLFIEGEEIESSMSMLSSIIVFDVDNDTYQQFGYPCPMTFTFKGISVNGVDKTKLIKNSYKETVKAVRSMVMSRAVAGTRYVDPETQWLSVYYNDGETWADVNDRYTKIAGEALFNGGVDPDLDEAVEGSVVVNGEPAMKFNLRYRDDYTGAKYGDKVGYKDKAEHPVYEFRIFNQGT